MQKKKEKEGKRGRKGGRKEGRKEEEGKEKITERLMQLCYSFTWNINRRKPWNDFCSQKRFSTWRSLSLLKVPDASLVENMLEPRPTKRKQTRGEPTPDVLEKQQRSNKNYNDFRLTLSDARNMFSNLIKCQKQM